MENSKHSDYKVAAVVVTYNRLSLLKECVLALRNQTRKLDEIIIVNNSSTDGTEAWLNGQKDLTVITQPNSGSSGGQHTGIKAAYELGYDWIWCMDDDCFASKAALAELLANVQKEEVLNCLVLSKAEPKKLTFGVYDITLKLFFTMYDEVKQKLKLDYASLFNGTLIPAHTVGVIGLPIHELFIKGDEIEYFHRIRKSGYKTSTVVKSIIYHPAPYIRVIKTSFFNHIFEFLDQDRRFFRARNFVYNYRKYRNLTFKTFIKFLILDMYGIIFYQKNFAILLNNVKGLIIGLWVHYDIKYPDVK